jgi:hypothetical protein
MRQGADDGLQCEPLARTDEAAVAAQPAAGEGGAEGQAGTVSRVCEVPEGREGDARGLIQRERSRVFVVRMGRPLQGGGAFVYGGPEPG